MVPSVEIVQDRLGLEVMRGCTQGCRFCQAGYWYRPVRELDPGDVAEMTKKFIAESGWSEVGLLSLSTADYSQIEPLVKCLAPQLSDRRVSISLPSLRAEAFSVGLADAVSEVRKSGFTFAPETGSDRLRRVINKTFTNADMIAAADVAFGRGWDLIKVYTMIGLPTETDEDLDELVTLVEGILAQGRKHGRKDVNVSVGSFVPKSWTPFQWAPFDGVPAARAQARVPQGPLPAHPRREDEVARAARGRDRVRAVARRPPRRPHSARRLELRASGSTAGPSTSATTSGCRRSTSDGIPKESYLRAYDLDEILPWDVLDVSIKKRWLQIELIKAKKEMRTEDCKWGHCYACGVPGNGEDTVLATSMPWSGRVAGVRRRDGARRATRPPIATSPRAPRIGRRRCRTCPRPRACAAAASRPRSSATASPSPRRATRASSRTATRWTFSSAPSAPRGFRPATRRGSTPT